MLRIQKVEQVHTFPYTALGWAVSDIRRTVQDLRIAELEIRPETGRTHQIRVHLASAGLPIVGDAVYGRARGDDARLGRPALHAAQLGFLHPRTGAPQSFEAPLPPDLLELVASLALEGEPALPPIGPGRTGGQR